jgi:phage tail-like protein
VGDVRNQSADPPSAACFSLDIDGISVGSFTEIGGLGVTIETEDLVEGGENGFVRRLPKGMKWQNVVLKRGVTDSDALLGWLSEYSGPGLEAQACSPKRRTVTVRVHRPNGATLHAWELYEAMPVRWTGPRLSSTARELALEELEVTHCGLKTVSGTA